MDTNKPSSRTVIAILFLSTAVGVTALVSMVDTLIHGTAGPSDTSTRGRLEDSVNGGQSRLEAPLTEIEVELPATRRLATEDEPDNAVEQPQLVTVSGTVCDSQGMWISGANVRALVSGMLLVRSESGGAGRYEITWPHGPEQVTLAVGATGFVPTAVTLHILRDQILAQNIALRRKVGLAGRVLDENGLGVSGARVNIRCSEIRYATTPIRTLANGAFEIPDAAEGLCQLLVVGPPEEGYREARTVNVEGGEEGILVVLRRSRGVSNVVVRTVGSDSESVTAACASIVPLNGDIDDSFCTGYLETPIIQVGAVLAEDVPAGRWRIWVGVEGEWPVYVDVDVSEGVGLVDEIAVVGRSATIEGRVRGLEESVGRRRVLIMPSHRSGLPTGALWERCRKGNPGNVVGVYHEVELRREYEFGPVDVPAGQLVVEARVEGYLARERVEAEPGQVARLEIDARRAGYILITGMAPSLRTRARVTIDSERPGWKEIRWSGVDEKREFRVGVAMPIGNVAWEVRFFDDFGGVGVAKRGEATVEENCNATEISVP